MSLHRNQIESADKSLEEFETFEQDEASPDEIGTDFTFKHKIKWLHVIGCTIYHILGIIAVVQFFTFQVKYLTFIYVFFIGFLGMFSMSMGAHRHFTHRAYKVNTTLRLVIIFCYTMIGQNSLWAWVRNHRQHHKYSDTDADPHNARRGFVFSHIGWLVTYKNPKLIQYGKGIDMSDLEADPWIMFQKKYVTLLYFVVTIFIPSIIPILLWNEDTVKSFMVCYVGRTIVTLNLTSLVNSITHTYGSRPYDKSILATENKLISFLSGGEGWHNFHHVFPWDYRASEIGMPPGWTTYLIDWCAKRGWIYDLKTVTKESIKNRMEKTGDNSYHH